jgi:phosphatidylserine/phosphatidylglycerophosphate/cardiolipin synthase-like enzyme
VYHGRRKPLHDQPDPADTTKLENEEAIEDAQITFATPRSANPQGAIMHDKFVVLLHKDASGAATPIAVWTGSTNWTEGAIYGQLNIGHGVYEPTIAAKYEAYFQLLRQDLGATAMKHALQDLTPVPQLTPSPVVPHGITPIFSPQSRLDMIELYAGICRQAKVLLVSAPFLLHEKIREAFNLSADDTLRFLLADKEGSFGKKGEIEIVQRNPSDVVSVATILHSPLNDFQGNLLEHAESFHHAGVHIHAKIIAADPFGTDPILVTGSANFSTNSTQVNDSNSLVIRGDTAVMDIYSTEFMRMFEHYWFRYRRSQKEQEAKAAGTSVDDVMALAETAAWSDPYYEAGSYQMRDRQAFAGTAV